MKTALEVLLDTKALLEGSRFLQSLNGGIYFEGTRPKDSSKEDLILIYTQGTSQQVERGTITIIAFTPDLPLQGGHTAPNLRRLMDIEKEAAIWVQSLSKGKSGKYLYHLAQAISHYPQTETQQHFVSIKLDYKYFGD